MNWLDAQHIINSFGDWAAIAVAAVIFLETAFILTSFLPGDSLLFLTGLALATSESWLPDWLGFILIWMAAFFGSQVGYWIGYKIGPPLFERNSNFLLNQRVLDKTHEFFEKYGARAVVMARFLPILRALIPMLAGISKMDSKRFTKLNALGSTIWVGLFMFAGYWLGQFPLVKNHLEITVIIIIVFTTMLLPIEILRTRIAKKIAAKKAR
ncbi:DedA family protein [Candidatus Aquiluna sp. UB-MaderosW2red]|uniref:DedA family protein n=1 Tax=Candidatus Aquiluna sp. UB-MaderosW2red TaxID=1855377 RepID=UPI000875D5DA|nr:DedA family protein [Candidatus Aquiluna sp. UB-MaderosW2red]SCX06372.1 membrane-associated protein [Candidatus Aquiluna sp. UB-MaderosW2red]